MIPINWGIISKYCSDQIKQVDFTGSKSAGK
jgi:hypothetical protein